MIAIPRLRAFGAPLGMTFRSRCPVPGARVARVVLLAVLIGACARDASRAGPSNALLIVGYDREPDTMRNLSSARSKCFRILASDQPVHDGADNPARSTWTWLPWRTEDGTTPKRLRNAVTKWLSDPNPTS